MEDARWRTIGLREAWSDFRMNIARKMWDLVGNSFGWQGGGFYPVWFAPETASGKVITPKSALQTIAVLRCATLIAGVGASLPISIFRKRPGQRHEDLPEHPLYRTLNQSPNPEMSAMDARAMMWLSFLLWGNAYARKVMDGNRVVALWPLLPDCMDVQRSISGDLVYLYTAPGLVPYPYHPEEILHVRWYSLDGAVGLSAIQQARQSIGMRQATEEYSARFFSNGAHLGLALQFPAKLSDTAIKNIRESFQAQHGGVENAHKVAILEQGATVSTLGVNPKDSQLLEQMGFGDEQIAMMMGVPPHMIGLVSKSTSWGSGIETQKQGFLDFTVQPLLSFWEASFERCLLSSSDQFVHIHHDTRAYVRADIKTRYDAYSIAVDKAIYNRNEVRALEGMEPYEGGDVYTVQMQMIPIQKAGQQTAAGQQPAPPQGGENAT